MPGVNQQTRDLLEAAEALEKMLQTIDQLAVRESLLIIFHAVPRLRHTNTFVPRRVS